VVVNCLDKGGKIKMSRINVRSSRETIASLRELGERDLVIIEKEVDVINEIAGVTKALDGGPVILFENIKGFPGTRVCSNMFGNRTIIAKMFGVEDPKKLKFRLLDALHNPIPPKVVDDAPSQEVVITDGIDVPNTIPIHQATPEDAGRILGGGAVLIGGPDKGTHVSFNRAHFRGKDWSSLSLNLGSHVEHHVLETRQGRGILPITLNILPPPPVLAVTGGFLPLSVPVGSDELGTAGGLQGSPIEICKAKTVDAYALAQAEWVIEGYVDTSEFAWESEEAEKLGKAGIAPFFPEYPGYVGRSYKTFKFKATAITHRKDSPIFYALHSHSIESNNLCGLIREAAVYDVCNRVCPGLVIDCNLLDAFKGADGIVIQVKKRRRRDEGYQRNVISAAWMASACTRMVIVVDEDVNIYSAEDVLWALNSRMNPTRDIMILERVRGIGTGPIERGEGLELMGVGAKIGFDCTVPLSEKWRFKKCQHMKVDLSNYLKEEDIAHARSLQNEFQRWMAETGF